MTEHKLRPGREQVYAIVREDRPAASDLEPELRIKVVRVVRSLERAVAETRRLQGLAAGGVQYFWQATQFEINKEEGNERT